MPAAAGRDLRVRPAFARCSPVSHHPCGSARDSAIVLVDAVPEAGSRQTAGLVAVLGDSVGVGIGDPALGGGWRGFAPLLAEALGTSRLATLLRARVER